MPRCGGGKLQVNRRQIESRDKLANLCRGAEEENCKLTDDKPRAESSSLNLCRGAEEGNFKLTDASFASARRGGTPEADE